MAGSTASLRRAGVHVPPRHPVCRRLFLVAAGLFAATVVLCVAIESFILHGRVVFRERVDLTKPQNLAIYVAPEDLQPRRLYRIEIVAYGPDQRLQYSLRGPEGNGIYYHVEQYYPGNSRSFQFSPSQQGQYVLRLEAARPNQGSSSSVADVCVLRNDRRGLVPFFGRWR